MSYTKTVFVYCDQQILMEKANARKMSDKIVRLKTVDEKENFRYFLEQLLSKPELSSELNEIKDSELI